MVTPANTTVFIPKITGLQKIHEGKVRDLYAVDDDHILIVTSDRLSAFDVVLPDPIPHKGRVLTEIANFWFARTGHIIGNQLAKEYQSKEALENVLKRATDDPAEQERLRGRSIVVRRLKALPLEAVVRGYIIGSGWKDYQRDGMVCGIKLPPGLRQADRLPEPLFTPASKAPRGEHDENISFDDIVKLVGRPIAEQVRDVSLKLYNFAAEHARARGIIIADTKFEFGLDAAGRLVLIDEALTPDSSRFWPADTWKPGMSPPSFDKQFVRDYLETLDWNKKAPGPNLPEDIIQKTSEKYQEAARRLTAQ